MPKKASIVIEVLLNEEGELRSHHRPLDATDQAEFDSWPSGGLAHIAHAMLIEALRRESYTMAITSLSSGTPMRELTVKEIDGLTRAHISEMMCKFSMSAAKEAHAMVSAAGEDPG